MQLNYKRTFFIGLAFMSICTFWQLYDSIVPLILKNTFNIGDTAAGAIMAADNVLALFMLPLFGALSDRTRTRFGKRMPYILLGTLLALISMLLLPLGDNNTNFALFISALFVTLVAMSTYRSPAVALMPDVTEKPLRSKANAVINLMGGIGGAAALLFINFLVPKEGKPDYYPVFSVTAALMLISVIILALTIKENKYRIEQTDDAQKERKAQLAPDVRKSLIFLLMSVFFWFMAYNAVVTAYSKYATLIWGFEGGSFAIPMFAGVGMAILSYIPMGLLATKIGRKKTIILGVVLILAAFVGAYFVLNRSFIVYLLFVVVGIGWAAINTNSYPMVVEMAQGSNIGRYTGYYYAFSMAAQVLTPIASGALMEHVGYHMLFPYAVLFSILALLTMSQVRHGDTVLLKRTKLEMLNIEG